MDARHTQLARNLVLHKPDLDAVASTRRIMAIPLYSTVHGAPAHHQDKRISKTATLREIASALACTDSISLTKFFRIRNFAPGAMQKCARELAHRLGFDEEAFAFKAAFEHGGGIAQTRSLNIHELGTVMSLDKAPNSLEFSSLLPEHGHVYIAAREQQDRICVHVGCSDALLCDSLINTFANNLGLEEVERPGQSKDRPPPSPVIEETSQTPPCHESPPSTTVCATRPSPLALPEKVTLGWLWQHVPLSLWFWLIGLVASAFLVGIRVGQIASIRQLFGQ